MGAIDELQVEYRIAEYRKKALKLYAESATIVYDEELLNLALYTNWMNLMKKVLSSMLDTNWMNLMKKALSWRLNISWMNIIKNLLN